jgi:hypothetical protein
MAPGVSTAPLAVCVVIRTFKPVETLAKGMGMTGQADSEHFVKMAAAGSPRGGREISR